MAKDQRSIYSVGQRRGDWLKIKSRKTEHCKIIGYTNGQGERSGLFGALHLAVISEGQLIYRGKVGTGFDNTKLKKLTMLLRNQAVTKKTCISISGRGIRDNMD